MIVLPWPPSTNNLFINHGKGRVKSPAYRAWLTEAYAAILTMSPRPKHLGPYAMLVVANPPDRRRRDLSNLLKATEDALVHCQVVEDDSLAQSITIRWGHIARKAGTVQITLEAA